MSVRDQERVVLESYERFPYASASQHHTHPSHVAAMAILHGLSPAPPEECTVLELGCADGGNLIPMALELPRSRFTGIDLSPRQIEMGRTFVNDLGITNLDLQAMSVLDLEPSFGRFDYIICHGVFSWVPEEVQQKILAICRDNLAPSGVAYVSYNTYPGWHLRRLVREMILFHTRGIDDPEQQAASAYDLLRFLSEHAGQGNDAHAVLLRTTQEHFEQYADRPSYVVHEYLEATNAPIYFHEFVARAAAHGLQHMAESEPGVTEVDNMPPQVASGLRKMAGTPVELEQYADFVVNRAFRRSLLVHADLNLDRTPSPERLARLYAASPTKVASPTPDLRPGIPETFTTERGRTFSSGHPLAKTVLAALAAAWPCTLSFADLGEVTANDPALADLLVSLHASGVIELEATPRACVNRVSDHPRVSDLAHRQALAGNLVTSQRRRVLKLDDPVALLLVRHLDGTRDRHALLRLLDREAAAGRLDLTMNGQAKVDPQRLPMVLEAVLDHHLRKMVEYALLVE